MDAAEAVTAEFEIVGHDACAGVAKVEGGFAMERMARVGVGNVHVRKGEAVEKGAVVVTDVVEDSAFALVEAVAERPFLPVDDLASFSRRNYGEACSLRLHYVQRLDIGSQFLMFRGILAAFGEIDWSPFLDLWSSTSWQSVNANDLGADSIYNRRDWKRKSVMISVLVVGIRWIAHVQEGLAHSLIVVNAIRP